MRLIVGVRDLFRRRSRRAWTPRLRGQCSCSEHVDELSDLVLPFRAGLSGAAPLPVAVGDLVEAHALEVRPLGEDEGEVDDVPGRFHWMVLLGDQTRSHYDDQGAPLGLDAALASRPGVERVEWLEREAFLLQAPTLCRDGVLACAARALLDRRVRATPPGASPS